MTLLVIYTTLNVCIGKTHRGLWVWEWTIGQTPSCTALNRFAFNFKCIPRRIYVRIQVRVSNRVSTWTKPTTTSSSAPNATNLSHSNAKSKTKVTEQLAQPVKPTAIWWLKLTFGCVGTNSVVWLHDSQLLTLDARILKPDANIQLDTDSDRIFNLKIANIDVSQKGSYKCQVTTLVTKNLDYQLDVLGKSG